MRVMKDSGIAWIGEIPADWSITILSALFYERKCKNRGLVEKNLLSLSYGNIVRKSIESNEGLLPASFETYNIVESGNIVFRLTDLQNDKRSLRTGLCKERGIITSAYVTLQIRSDDSPRYMHYLFHTYDLCKVFYGLGDGVRQGMNYEDLKHLQVLRPDLKTQHRIADYLDRKCSQIDAIIARQQEVIEKLKAYKLSVITEAVTKGLNPHAPMKDSGVEWIGEIPEQWETASISRVATVVRGASPRPAGDPRYFNGQDVPWITVAEVTKDDGKYIFSTESYLTKEGAECSRLVEKGTLLLSNSGATLGVPKVTLITGCINDGSVAFLDLNIEQMYLLYVFKSRTLELRKQMQGYGQPNLNTTIVKNIVVPLPHPDEQKSISEYLDKRCKAIDDTIEMKEKVVERLSKYKKSLIYEVVTGKEEV